MRPVKSCSELVSPDRRGQRLARVRQAGQLVELAAIGFGEQLGFPLGAREIGGEARRVHAFVQILQGATPAARQDPPEQRDGETAASREWTLKLIDPFLFAKLLLTLLGCLAPTKRRF